MRTPCIVLAATLAAITPATAADLLLKRVMLSSAGVGYFEYEAAVSGPASLGLDVKLDQVDDVLKSLAVFDDTGAAGTAVGTVELPGRDDTHGAFGDVPFGPEALRSPVEFLNSLQGVELNVQGPRPMSGRLLRAEVVREPPDPRSDPPNSPPATRTRVSLLTSEGLRQFVLEDSEGVQVADEALRERIGRALAASRRQGTGDSRHITLRIAGDGQRTVHAGFVAVAPLWKASYRLLLPAPDADPVTARARLQGWATLENATGVDWSGVSLSVQYGNPVTFHQALYRSYFVARPEVPVEVLGRLLPGVDTRARPVAVPPPPPPPPSPAGGLAAASRMASPAPAQSAPALAPPAEPAAVQETAEETVFSVPFPVSLQAGHSASVPLLDVSVPAQRISVATEGQAHPLAAIRIDNTTGASLPAGVLTLYDLGSSAPYAGDARLGGLPPGETRLLSYAQDLRTTIEWRSEDSTRIVAMAASGGVLTVDTRHRQVTHATVTAPASEPRRVLLEVPKPDGGEVASGFATPSEQTMTAWRFAADLQPGAVRELVFAVDTREQQTFALLDDEDVVATVLNLQGASPAARAALQRIADLRQVEAARTAERDTLNSQRDQVNSDEERLRANLGAVGPGDAVRSRLLRQLDADETRLADLTGAIGRAEAAVTAAHKALTDAVASLRL